MPTTPPASLRTLDKDAKTETFEDTQVALLNAVRRFQRRYGGDMDELIAQANLLFLQAYERYDPARGSFTAYVGFYVYRQLIEGIRKTLMRRARCRPVDIDPDSLTTANDPTRLVDLMASLSPDAATIVQLILKTPPDLLLILREQRYNTTSAVKSCVREMLADAGWVSDRITNGFTEIESALQS